MPAYVKPEVILKKLNLAMPMTVTLEDPVSRQPLTVSYDNLHALLVLDVEHMVLERQVIANIYAEMARLSAAAEFESVRAEIRYRQWRERVVEAWAPTVPEKKTAAGKKAAKQGPTKDECEAYYRTHDEYADMYADGARWKIIAELFKNLMWSFKLKSEALGAEEKAVGGFSAVVRNADTKPDSDGQQRLDTYENLSKEASEIAAASGSSQALADLLNGASSQLSSTPPPTKPKAPRALED